VSKPRRGAGFQPAELESFWDTKRFPKSSQAGMEVYATKVLTPALVKSCESRGVVRNGAIVAYHAAADKWSESRPCHGLALFFVQC
jgi:hypothetical protein